MRTQVHCVSTAPSTRPTPQQLFALAFLRDMCHQQIAEHLNMPLGTAKTHIRKALNALQGLLKHVRIGAGE